MACVASHETRSMADFIMHPWHLLLAALSGAVNGEQQRVIEQA